MSVEDNKAAIRRDIERLNRTDWADQWPDSEPWKEEHARFRAAFPDYHFTIDDIVAEGDTVAVFGTVHATHRGEFPVAELKGITPTGKHFTWTEAYLMRFKDGAAIETRMVVDGVARLQQLGVLPAPEST